MQKALLITLSVAAMLGLAYAQDNTMDVFKIDLNAPPKLRFAEPTKKYRDDIITAIEYYEQVLITPSIPMQFQVAVDYGMWFAQREKYLEMDGIASILGISTRRVVVCNYAYEFVAFCTSILARQTDGTVLHMRMFDFLAPEISRNMSYVGQFYRGDAYLFDAVLLGGSPTFPTGFKKGNFSISLNQRNTQNRTQTELFANMGMVTFGYKQVSELLRDTLEKCDDYDCAVNMLSNTTVCNTGYYIVAGITANQGVVISRDRWSVANITNLTDTNWYIVQTNDDHFAGVCRERCQAANANIQTLGQANLNVTSLYDDVLSVSPNLNFGSIYSSIMVPSVGLWLNQVVNGTYKPSDM